MDSIKDCIGGAVTSFLPREVCCLKASAGSIGPGTPLRTHFWGWEWGLIMSTSEKTDPVSCQGQYPLDHSPGMLTVHLFAFYLVSQPWHRWSSFLGCKDKFTQENVGFPEIINALKLKSVALSFDRTTHHLPRARSRVLSQKGPDGFVNNRLWQPRNSQALGEAGQVSDAHSAVTPSPNLILSCY